MKRLNAICGIFTVVSALMLAQAASAASDSFVTEHASASYLCTCIFRVHWRNLGVMSSRQAAKMNPVDALRFEQ